MKQSTALRILKAGKNVFLTGSAGAGKTYVLNQYIQYLKERRVPVAVTASTGIAATHMNGMTIHAWSGIGVRTHLSQKDLEFMKTKKYLRDKLEAAKVLIIDEISMLHKTQLDMVNQVLKFFKGNDYAFGGIQVIFSGDFFQLPPVGLGTENNREKFAFMSKAWLEAKLAICYLTEQHRQESGQLNQILNEIRNNTISQNSLQLLKEAAHTTFPKGWEPPMLYSHNHDVNRTNNQYLRALDGKITTFEATTKGNKKLLDLLKNSVRAEEQVYLKEGAKVMFVKNNYEHGYINGTLGKVMGYSPEGFPHIMLSDGKQLIAEPNEWSIEDDMGKSLASYQQIPIRLAWAITVHKSQGMTLDYAKVDLSRTFEKGQGYVALSRLKNLAGLQLTGFNDIALQVDPLAFKADKRFQELSSEIEAKIDATALEKRALGFLRHCGGLTDPEDIERYKKKKKEKKHKKKATHLITKELVDQNWSIQQIAAERGLTESTITGHIAKLHDLFPTFDWSPYAPPAGILQKVQAAYNQILAANKPDDVRPDGSVSSKALYEAMNQEIGYTQIKLALLFIQ
ncbi:MULTISPECIES: AAA family ATPase [unclassified Aureispira]|uniref:AAA family ATPase n=1 Tax=unclassified Aureispira TaxID=2649989 RepID=UPI000695EFD6|nr:MULTISPECIES: helix-turn-helix domain-containing protein [unclassified Aureispira]WMX12924.1 AAA family ATPase [Aureispira sp. CCB-E]